MFNNSNLSDPLSHPQVSLVSDLKSYQHLLFDNGTHWLRGKMFLKQSEQFQYVLYFENPVAV